MALSDKKKKEIFESVDRKTYFILVQNFGDDVLRKVHEHVAEGMEIQVKSVEGEIDNLKVIAVSDERQVEITE